MDGINAAIFGNLGYIFIALVIIIALMIGFIVSLEMRLSDMKRHFRQIAMGGDDNASPQEILIKHAEKINSAIDAEEKLNRELNRIKNLASKSISRVAVVRFNAFQDDTLLDAENSGVIISSLTGRDFSRSYVKPIEKGNSQNYKLTKEEEQALREASSK